MNESSDPPNAPSAPFESPSNEVPPSYFEAVSDKFPNSVYPSIESFSSYHSSTSPSSHLYCVGGKNTSNKFRISKFDPASHEWLQVFENRPKRFSFGIAAIDSKIYLAGGSEGLAGKKHRKDFNVYDCQTGSFEDLPKLPLARESCSMIAFNGSLFLSSGYLKRNDGMESTKDVLRFDFHQNQWNNIQSMNYSRADHEMFVYKGHLYVIGGNAHAMEQYNPSINQWIEVPADLIPQKGRSIALHDNVIYACGEQCFEMLLLDDNFTEIVLPQPKNVRLNSLVSFNGKLLAIGGCLNMTTHQTDIMYEFDTRKRSWIRLPDLDFPRKRHRCIVVNF